MLEIGEGWRPRLCPTHTALESRIRKHYGDLDTEYHRQDVHWHREITEAETALSRICFGQDGPPRFFETLFNPTIGLGYCMTYFLGDVVAYTSRHDNGIRAAFWKTVGGALKEHHEVPYSYLAHSLGSVLVFDYLFYLFYGAESGGYDGRHFFLEKPDPAVAEGDFSGLRQRFRGLVTFGSPIALLLLREPGVWRGARLFSQVFNPVRPPRRWINLT